MLISASGLPYAPQPRLNAKRVEREHEHAPAEVAVGDVDLVVGFDDADLLELADDHRRRRRILRAERGAARSACASTAGGIGRRLRQECRDGSASALAPAWRLPALQADGTAVLALGCARDLARPPRRCVGSYLRTVSCPR